ncbi:hypothetical protein SeLEV6574_g00407 [Synchytrium endobioticum]|uniref:7-dehydrocholesterol reductase n=1 Tax=Synchytrium endobioticum TaxID=286115 RepID=A0A507DJ41_9FUNG|nr:hypothetical protein SeLEV6574_g00407 [Synchytrium endobioticum]
MRPLACPSLVVCHLVIDHDATNGMDNRAHKDGMPAMAKESPQLTSRKKNGVSASAASTSSSPGTTSRVAQTGDTWGRAREVGMGTIIGSALIMLLCPLMVIYFYISCNSFGCELITPGLNVFQLGPVGFFNAYFPKPTIAAFQIYLTWLAFQIILAVYLPGKTGYGQRTPAGYILPYIVNGLLAWLVTHALFFILTLGLGLFPASVIHDNWGGLLVAANVYGYFLTAFSFLKAHCFPTHAEDRKFSNSWIYDLFMGIEFNPRIASLDFKLFHNGRPGIIAWTLIDISFAAAQYAKIGYITNQMLLINLFHTIYVLDFFYNEDWYLRTIDIAHDHFGFYLSWGDTVWLPFMYTFQSHYAVINPIDLSTSYVILVLAVGLGGYYIFRSVNDQKDKVRAANGNINIWGKPAKVIRTEYTTSDGKVHKSILLTSGFWGLARHFNYAGDLMISLAMYRIYRDDHRCRAKTLLQILFVLGQIQSAGAAARIDFGWSSWSKQSNHWYLCDLTDSAGKARYYNPRADRQCSAYMAAQVDLGGFENDIPPELKDFPPRITLATLDKNLDQLVAEINILNDSRQKDYANTDGRRDRLGVAPAAGTFTNFRQMRQDRLNGIQKIEPALRIKSSSRPIAKELDRYWRVEFELGPTGILDVLESFYKNKAVYVLEENSLLVSRWARFCRTAHDVNMFHATFSRYQAYLQNEYTDSLDRYDRLSKLRESQLKSTAKEERPKDIQELLAEKKNKQQSPKTAPMEDTTARRESQFKAQTPSRTKTDPFVLPNEIGVDVSDLVVYIRWIITQWSGSKDIEKFIRRMKVAVHSERVPIFQFFQTIISSQPGEILEDVPACLEGINCYVEKLPLKNAKIEDFITEFDTHLAFFKVETSIAQEDGRPLFYEVESKFQNRFQEQITDLVPVAPYEWDAGINTADAAKTFAARKESMKSLGETLSSASTNKGRQADSAFAYQVDATRLRKMDWNDYICVTPKYEEWLEDQMVFISSLRQTDYELRYMYDLVASQDMDSISLHLRDSAKRLFDIAAAANPNAVHSSSSKGTNSSNVAAAPIFMRQGQTFQADTDEPRSSRPFDLGMLMPDAKGDKPSDIWVLDERKIQFGTLLARNDELRQIEEEMSGIHGAKVPTRVADPTIATIFAEHEIHAFVLLRYLKLRDVRSVLLRQLNFFRSVEKRVNVDVYRNKKRHRYDPNEGTQPPLESTILMQAASAGRMWRQQELFDLPDNNHSQKDSSIYGQHTPTEDLRMFGNGKIYTRDYDGTSFIYDAAMKDLEKLEVQLIKIGTLYINGGVGGHEAADTTYMDEMRSKVSERRSDANDETFLNSGVDRSQILLELYEHEIKFQNAKIEWVNCLLEAFEHTRDPVFIERLAQLIIDMQHLRPNLTFETSYFSRDYSLHTKALEIQASLLSQIIAHGISSYRSWVARHFMKIDKSFMTDDDDAINFVPPETGVNLNKYIDSPVASGLPFKPTNERQRVTMHHGALSVYMTEVVPMLERVVDLFVQSKFCAAESMRAIKSHVTESLVTLPAIECANWAIFTALWQEMMEEETAFTDGPCIGLESDIWTENPLLADVVITEVYNPYHYTSTDNARAMGVNIGPMTAFSDPAYQDIARNYAHLLARSLLLKNRLTLAWVETEFWRRALDLQYVQMGVNRRAYGARLAPLPIDGNPLGPDVISTEEEEIEDYQDDSFYESYTDLVSASSDLQNFGLAMQEIDRLYDDFNFSTFEALQFNLRWQVIRAMTHALRVQLLEKNYLVGAVELHSLYLAEIHKNVLSSSFDPGFLDSSQRSLDIEVDYRLLATSIIPKKRKLRKAMLLSYSERLPLYIGDEKDEDAKKLFIDQMRDELINWYCANLAEVVVEWSERSEFAKLMLDVKQLAIEKPYGKLIFRHSKLHHHLDYFASLEKGIVEENENSLGVAMQDVVMEGGTEKIAKLWYLPHITEITLGITPADKGNRSITDTARRAFRNSLVYRRSLTMYTLVYDILVMLSRVANLLMENSKFVSSARTIREADYVVAALNSMKKDLSYQGSQADYERVERYLLMRWGLLRLRLKLSLTTSMYALKMNLLKSSYGIVETAWHQSAEKGIDVPHKDAFQRIGRYSNVLSKIVRTPLPGKHWLNYLKDQAKRVCDAKIVEVEECLEENVQSTTLNFGENADELIKAQGEYLVSTLRLYALRNEYLRTILNGRELETEEQLQECFRVYKTRILVDAVRIYHQQGSRGGASSSSLLRTGAMHGSQEGGYSRLVQSNFEKCQIVVLQAEILREYTINLHKHMKSLHSMLSDERTGRLFRHYQVTDAIAESGVPHHAIRFTEESYAAKQLMLTHLVTDLYKASVDYAKDTRPDIPVFTCTKPALSHAILRFTHVLGRWNEKRRGEHENFLGTLFGRLLDMIRSAEKIIDNMKHEKQQVLDDFDRGVRLAAADLFAGHLATQSATTVELNDLRKARRLDEKKLRNRIVDEYDDLMAELVMEVNLLRQRFAEYRVGTVQEVMDIMSETKKEELGTLITSKSELPMAMRKSAEVAIQHEEEIAELREDNHELKMTILKFRSMNTIKEQAIRSAYEKKIRKLTDENKKAEEKLWDTFRETEAREKALRRQLARKQKNLTDAEATNAELTAKLKDERETRIAEKIRERPEPRVQKKVESVNNEEYSRLVKELSEKSKLIEQLVSERQAALQQLDSEDIVQASKVGSRPTTSNSPPKSARRSAYVNSLEKENAELKLQLDRLQETLSILPNNISTAARKSKGEVPEIVAARAAEPSSSASGTTGARKVNFQESPEPLFTSASARYPHYEGRRSGSASASPWTATGRRDIYSRLSVTRPSTSRGSESGLNVTNSNIGQKSGTASSARTLASSPRSPSRR